MLRSNNDAWNTRPKVNNALSRRQVMTQQRWGKIRHGGLQFLPVALRRHAGSMFQKRHKKTA